MALRGGPDSGPTPWARPQLLYAPETSPQSRGPASLRDDANTQSRRRPAPSAGPGPVPAEHVRRAFPGPARGARVASRWHTWGGVWLHLLLTCRRAVAPRAGSHPLGPFVTKTEAASDHGSQPSKVGGTEQKVSAGSAQFSAHSRQKRHPMISTLRLCLNACKQHCFCNIF